MYVEGGTAVAFGGENGEVKVVGRVPTIKTDTFHHASGGAVRTIAVSALD